MSSPAAVNPKPRNRTFHLRPEDQSFFADRRHGDEGVTHSDILHCVLTAYRRIIARHLPALPRESWALICDALPHGFPTADATFYPVAFEVEDAIAANSLDTKWGVEAKELAKTLEALTPEANLAVYDFVARFWASASDEPPLERIEAMLRATRTIRPHQGTLPA